MGPSKVLTTFPLQIQNSWQLSLLELHPTAVKLRLPPWTPSTCIFPLHNLAPSANAGLPPHPGLQTSYPSSAHFISSLCAPSPPSLVPGCPSTPPASPPSLTLLGFFNGMLEVIESGVLNYFTFFGPILLTLSASRNPILIHFSLSGFLDSLHCVLIAPTPGLPFSLVIHSSGGVIIFVRQGLFFSELSTCSLFLLGPYSDYVWVKISHNNFSSFSFLNVYALYSLFSDGWQIQLLFSLHFLIIHKFVHWVDFNCHHPLRDLTGISDTCGEDVFDWIISSDLFPINDPDTPTLLHRSSGSRFSSNIFFAPSSLAFSCSWEVLQNLGSDHLPILLSVPLCPVFHPNKRPLPLTFRKLAGVTLPITLTPTVLLQRNTRFSLFLLLLVVLPL